MSNFILCTVGGKPALSIQICGLSPAVSLPLTNNMGKSDSCVMFCFLSYSLHCVLYSTHFLSTSIEIKVWKLTYGLL